MRSRSKSSSSSSGNYPGFQRAGTATTLPASQRIGVRATTAVGGGGGGTGGEGEDLLRDFVQQLVQIALKTRIVQKAYAESIGTFGLSCDMPLDPVADEKKIAWLFSPKHTRRLSTSSALSSSYPSQQQQHQQKTSPTLSPTSTGRYTQNSFSTSSPTAAAAAAPPQKTTKRSIYLSIYLQDDSEQMGMLECIEFEYSTTSSPAPTTTTSTSSKAERNALIGELGRELRSFYLYMNTRGTRAVAYELLRDCSSTYRIHYELSVKRPFWDARHYTQEVAVGGSAGAVAMMAACCGGGVVRMNYTEWLGNDARKDFNSLGSVDALFASLMRDATGRTFSPRRQSARRISMGAAAVPRPNFKVDGILSAAAAVTAATTTMTGVYGSAPQQQGPMSPQMQQQQQQRMNEYHSGRSDAELLSYHVPPLPFLSRHSVAPGSSGPQMVVPPVPTITTTAAGYGLYAGNGGGGNSSKNKSAVGIAVGVRLPQSLSSASSHQHFSRPMNVPKSRKGGDCYFQPSSLPQNQELSPPSLSSAAAATTIATTATAQMHPFAATPFTPPSSSEFTPSPSSSSSSSSSSSFGLGKLVQPDDGNFCVLPSTPRDNMSKKKRRKRRWDDGSNAQNSWETVPPFSLDRDFGKQPQQQQQQQQQQQHVRGQFEDVPKLFNDPCECSYDYALNRDAVKYGFMDAGDEDLDLFTIVNNPPENMFVAMDDKSDKNDKGEKHVPNVAQLLNSIDSKMLLNKSIHV